MIGTTVSHYRVLQLLGVGGMGIVYLAEDERLHRKVALKFLPPATAADPQARARFTREAQSASALDHSNIATIYEIADWDGQPFIAMAFYEGETLKQRLDRGALELKDATSILSQIAAGLAAAHSAGIVHRDLKPANVLLTTTGQAKILDFGLAKLQSENQDTAIGLTGAGTTVGTVAYMSPEQASGRDVDQRADVWALGVVAYEMLAGRRPFQADSAAAMLLAVATEKPALLKAHRPDVPPELERIVSRALERSYGARTLTATEICQELGLSGAPVFWPAFRCHSADARRMGTRQARIHSGRVRGPRPHRRSGLGLEQQREHPMGARRRNSGDQTVGRPGGVRRGVRARSGSAQVHRRGSRPGQRTRARVATRHD